MTSVQRADNTKFPKFNNPKAALKKKVREKKMDAISGSRGKDRRPPCRAHMRGIRANTPLDGALLSQPLRELNFCRVLLNLSTA